MADPKLAISALTDTVYIVTKFKPHPSGVENGLVADEKFEVSKADLIGIGLVNVDWPELAQFRADLLDAVGAEGI